MGFILGTLAMLAFLVGVLLLVGHFYPGSGADLVDWKPTRSYEDEARLEEEDVQQMIDAQNEMRRRRGARRDDRGGAAREGRRGRAEPAARPRPVRGRLSARRLARALIVGCGCRGRALGARLAAEGWAVRGHEPQRGAAWRRSRQRGSSPRWPTPTGPGPCSSWSATSRWSIGCSASPRGEPELIAAIHGPRLERLLEKLVDTPVRGFVYEAAGSVDAPESASAARGSSSRAGATWRIRSRWLLADPPITAAWLEAMVAATAAAVLSRAAEGGYWKRCGERLRLRAGCDQGAWSGLFAGALSSSSTAILPPM